MFFFPRQNNSHSFSLSTWTGPSFHLFERVCDSCLDPLQPLQAFSGGGDTDCTQHCNEELTDMGPATGMTWVSWHIVALSCVRNPASFEAGKALR